jgi:ribosome maturation factor RimP
MTTPARLQQLIEPIVTGLGLELFDLQYTGSTLTVLLDRPAPPATGDEAPADGPGRRPGLDLAAITRVTRAVSRALDEADPIAGRYSLEVSSAGLERPLRTPAHFVGAVGETISVKTVPGSDGPRRLRGRLVRAAGPGNGGASIDVRVDTPDGELHTVAYADIDKARTVFEWGPEPKPAKPRPTKPGRRAGGGAATRDTAAPSGDAGSGLRDDTAPAPAAGHRGADAGTGTDGSATLDEPDAMINGDDKKVSAT